jgi:Domain of unknown function DUF11
MKLRFGSGPRTVLAISPLAALVALLLTTPAASASTGTCGANGAYTVSGQTATCTYTTPEPFEDTFTVPSNVSSLSVTAVGASGGNTVENSTTIDMGGLGAQVTNPSLPVTPGAALYVDVGAPGQPGEFASDSLSQPCTDTAGAAGPPDGGDGAAHTNPVTQGCTASGGGGGSSALLSVSRATATLTGNAGDSRLLVAGGGGGAGSYFGSDGSNGGSAGVATVTGAGSGGCNGGGGGEGGVGSGGGAAGCDGGNNGTATAGGAGSGNLSSGEPSGGGGGGWIGGGTDTRGAGGGAGSSYGGAGSGTVSISTASATQGPEVVISWLVGPSVSTQASGSVTVGGSISDTATVSGGYSPTGTVTFNLYSNSAGSGTPLFTDANVSLQNGSATSTGYTTTATGTDYWVATYNGDSNNSSESSGASSEPVSIGKASPSITTTQQPASAVVGSTVADQATVSGLVDPSSGDTVTFDLYSSSTTQNASTLLYSSTVPLGSGTATSGSYTTKSTGTDYWVATFNGDANNGSVSSTASGEPVTVTTASKLADLSVQIGGPASAADGTSFNETVTVHNAGPATAGDVLSALVVPAGVSVTSTGGGSEVFGVVYWTAAQINANSTVTYTVTFIVAAKVQGTVLIPAATVSLQNPDPNHANNVASTTIRLGSSGMLANIARHLQNPIPAGKGLAAYLLRLTHPHHAERRPDHRSRSEVVRAPARRHSARQRWRAPRHAG